MQVLSSSSRPSLFFIRTIPVSHTSADCWIEVKLAKTDWIHSCVTSWFALRLKHPNKASSRVFLCLDGLRCSFIHVSWQYMIEILLQEGKQLTLMAGRIYAYASVQVRQLKRKVSVRCHLVSLMHRYLIWQRTEEKKNQEEKKAPPTWFEWKIEFSNFDASV